MGFSINRQSPTPMFEQICEAIRAQVASGDLREGFRLPPTRMFATDLGVSRSTMVNAYEQLVAEGYLQSVPGSGYTICSMGIVELDATPVPDKADASEEKIDLPRPFQAGQPDMRLFPHTQWAKTVSRVCRTNPKAMLVGGSLLGNFELRKAIANHVSEWRGIEASPHQIIITAGSGDALEICIRTLTRFGDIIGLENPGYLPLRKFVSVLGLSPTFLEIVRNGASLPDRAKNARLVVLTPSHQYPLGGVMSPSRRLEFIQWAEKHNSWIIEDDYDSEFRYAGRPIPAMAGFDKLNRTIYVGSFSKIFSNSLRLGYVIVPHTLLEEFKSSLTRFGVKASYMPQQALAEFIENGEFYRHLRRVRRLYGERRKYLLDRLTSDFGGYGSLQDHQAGMQIAFHLNSRYLDTDIARHARPNGLSVLPLSQFCSKKNCLNGLLLGFCGFSTEELKGALLILKGVMDRHRLRSSRHPVVRS